MLNETLEGKVAVVMQEKLQWASEISGYAHTFAQLFCTLHTYFVPWKGTSLEPHLQIASSCCCVFLFATAVFHIYLAWCDWVREDPHCLLSGVTVSWETGHTIG